MRTAPSRVLAVLVGLVVLAGLAAGLVASRRTAQVLDVGTPQGVTQAYVQRVLDGDDVGAAELLASSSGCDVQDVAQAYLPEQVRVVLDTVAAEGDDAVVTLRVTDRYGQGLFDASEYSHTERVTLVREPEGWRVAASAWLLPSCRSKE